MREADQQPQCATSQAGRGDAGQSGTNLHLLLLANAVFVSLSMNSPLSAQPTETAPSNFKLTGLGGYLEFTARDRRSEQTSKTGSGDKETKETIFQESLQLETSGFVYHPNLLEFAASGKFGLIQSDFEDIFGNRRRTSSDNGEIIEFDFTGDFLQKKPYPGSVFARRYFSLEPRPFQSTLQTTTTNLGLNWQYVSVKTPTSLQLSHTVVELEPTAEDERPGRQENTNARFETAYKVSEHNAFSFVLNYLEVREEPFVINYESTEATASHRLDFGSAHQHRLDSEINYLDQTGTFEIERLRWREMLRLEHTEALRSRYVLEITDRTQGLQSGVPPFEEQTYRLSGLLEHELYESLVSQLEGFALLQRFESGAEIDRSGVFGNLDYRKTNPLGVLSADYRIGAQTEDRSGGFQEIEVLDERHTFADPEPVILANANVQPGSIQITAEDRTTFYVLGRDYNTTTRGDRVEIRRVPTGRISDGDTVLIDYVFSLGGDSTLDTFSQNFAIRQDFDFGLTPYYRLRWQDETLSPKDAVGAIEDDITSNLIGAEYRWRGLRLAAEFEDHDSTVTPFEATRLRAGYTHMFNFGATGNVNVRWSDVDYRLPTRNTEFFTVEGRYRHPITRQFTVEGAVLYRNEDDSISGNDEGVDIDLTLEWLVRETEIRATFEFADFEDEFVANESTALFVQVRRRF